MLNDDEDLLEGLNSFNSLRSPGLLDNDEQDMENEKVRKMFEDSKNDFESGEDHQTLISDLEISPKRQYTYDIPYSLG